jgi:hypothetical protein
VAGFVVPAIGLINPNEGHMDKGVKNSLLFGAIVGGVYALSRSAVEKKQLTEGQRKDLEMLKDAFLEVESVLNKTVVSASAQYIREHAEQKDYQAIGTCLQTYIDLCRQGMIVPDHFHSRLDQLLSTRFTAERANAKTHEVQSRFASLTPLPDRLGEVLQKRLAIFELMRSGFDYIATSGSNDFKTEEIVRLKQLTQDLSTLETRLGAVLEKVQWV